MKMIKLTQGKTTFVDDEDYEDLNKFKWHARKGTNTYYGRRSIRFSIDEVIHIGMHTQIMNTPDGMQIDHIDGNGLNNLKSNLRICTRSENLRNRKKQRNTSSKYKGVCYYKHLIKRPYKATISKTFLGMFSTEKEAALAYNTAAKKYFGEFARLNEID